MTGNQFTATSFDELAKVKVHHCQDIIYLPFIYHLGLSLNIEHFRPRYKKKQQQTIENKENKSGRNGA